MAVVAAMAIVGVSSAMASSTQLCKEDGAGACPAGQGATKVHFISVDNTGASAKAKLLSEAGTVECNVLISGTLLEFGARRQDMFSCAIPTVI